MVVHQTLVACLIHVRCNLGWREERNISCNGLETDNDTYKHLSLYNY